MHKKRVSGLCAMARTGAVLHVPAISATDTRMRVHEMRSIEFWSPEKTRRCQYLSSLASLPLVPPIAMSVLCLVSRQRTTPCCVAGFDQHKHVSAESLILKDYRTIK